jgi:hypothetical protein
MELGGPPKIKSQSQSQNQSQSQSQSKPQFHLNTWRSKCGSGLARECGVSVHSFIG